MTRVRRDMTVLYILGAALNGFVAALVNNPGYTDAYYYYNGAFWFVQGGPLTEPYIWNYVAAPSALPVAAFAYWQPLPSILAAVGIKAFGWMQPFDAAQIPFVLCAALLPTMSYRVGRQLGERRHGLLAGLLTVFSGFYVRFWSLPESFTPFAVSGAGALLLTSWGLAQPRWWKWFLSGAAAGLAHLSRADGVLLMGIISLMALLPAPQASWSRRGSKMGLAAIGYLLIMGPWFARNLTAFGSAQAPGGLSTLWLVHYNDMFLYPMQMTPDRYLAAGWKVIAETKLGALWQNLQTFVAVQNLVFLTPLSVIGLARRWRHLWLMPAVLYGAALFLAMTVAFTWPGMNGGWLHSGAALLPFIMAAGAAGLDDTIRWIARRRAGWSVAQARQVFGAGAVAMAIFLTVWLLAASVVGLPYSGQVAWNRHDIVYREVGEALAARGVPSGAPVMVNNPPGFYTHTGHGGVPLPSGDETMLLRAADAYDIEYLIVDQNVAEPLLALYWEGPSSGRLELLDKFGDESQRVYLYHIAPEPHRQRR